ncbi:MAG: PAS domain S-box protein [Gemmatimonadota bacterium]|nr:PAS domain S-box protein [Gemmatimonadota bacterium]
MIETLTSAQTAFHQAEVAQRNYLITGDLLDLTPEPGAQREVRDGLLAVRRLTADNAAQQARLDALVPMIERRFARLEYGVAVRQAQGLAPAALIVGSDLTKALRDSIRAGIMAVTAEEHRLLAARELEEASSVRATKLTIVVGALLALVLVPLFYVVIARDVEERKRAAEAIRESERKYRTVVEQASDGIILADASGTIVDVNRRACEITGYAREELTGKTFADLIPPEELAVSPIRFAHIAESKHLMADRTMRCKNGSEILVEASTTMLDDGRIQTVLRDITARRRAEQAVRESERRFREILETVRSVAVCLDVHGNVTFCNDSLLALTGWQRDQVVGRNWFETFVPARNEIGPMVFEAMTRGGILAHYESEILTREGERRLISWDNTVLRNSTGQMIGTASLGQDITDRRRAQEAQARLTTILEATPDLVAIWTVDGHVLYLNRAGRRMLNIGDEETGAGFTIGALQPHWQRDVALGEAIRTVLRDGYWSGEITLKSRDGREVPVSQVILAHKSPAGTVEYFSTIMRDITERKQAEATLRTLSLYDELTQLCNRRGFMTLGEQELKVARRAKSPTLLLYMDLNDFKSVNDTYGHAEGDAALVRIAEVLKSTFRESDVVARLGGDEFTVLVVNAIDDTEEVVLTRLRNRLAAANAHATHPYELSISIGIARFDHAAPRTLDELLQDADAALYQHKRSRLVEARAAS